MWGHWVELKIVDHVIYEMPKIDSGAWKWFYKFFLILKKLVLEKCHFFNFCGKKLWHDNFVIGIFIFGEVHVGAFFGLVLGFLVWVLWLQSNHIDIECRCIILFNLSQTEYLIWLIRWLFHYYPIHYFMITQRYFRNIRTQPRRHLSLTLFFEHLDIIFGVAIINKLSSFCGQKNW